MVFSEINSVTDTENAFAIGSSRDMSGYPFAVLLLLHL